MGPEIGIILYNLKISAVCHLCVWRYLVNPTRNRSSIIYLLLFIAIIVITATRTFLPVPAGSTTAPRTGFEPSIQV